MELTCIGTGSKQGNCYILTIGGETIILDAGVPIKSIKSALNFNITHVWGCLVTHGHSDHAKSVNDIRMMGLPVFEPYLQESKRKMVQLGGFRVVSFEVTHDGEPCVGFYITNGDFRMVYATDFEYLPLHFAKQAPNVLLIECNHMDELVSDDEVKYAHSVLGHASLEVTKGIVEANTTDSLRSVILCHLSDGWSDEKKMKSEVESIVPPGVSVHVATAGCKYTFL